MTDAEKTERKKKRTLIMTIFFLLIFAFTFTKNVLLYKRNQAPSTSTDLVDAAQSLSDQLVVVTNIRLYDKIRKERVKLWDREWERDPFAAPQVMASLVKAVNLTLNGILWDENTPRAIVNEKTLHKGDTIYGYTVLDIKPRSVLLKTGEKNIELQVFRAVIPEPAPKS